MLKKYEIYLLELTRNIFRDTNPILPVLDEKEFGQLITLIDTHGMPRHLIGHIPSPYAIKLKTKLRLYEKRCRNMFVLASDFFKRLSANKVSYSLIKGGDFSLFSGNSKMRYFMSDVKRDSYNDIYYNGTIVTAEIRDDSDNFSIEKALEFHGIKSSQSNIIELNYLSDDCKTFSFVMKNESNGFGNRVVGRLLRRKLHNIINSEKEIPIVIDWSGIPIISSSFADEFIGKLFLELGPIAFSSKIRNIGMEPIIHGLLDKAISQRLTQANDDL